MASPIQFVARISMFKAALNSYACSRALLLLIRLSFRKRESRDCRHLAVYGLAWRILLFAGRLIDNGLFEKNPEFRFRSVEVVLKELPECHAAQLVSGDGRRISKSPSFLTA